MAVQVSKVKVYQNEYDFSGDMTEFTLDIGVEKVDNTVLDPATTTRTNAPGLIEASITGAGYMELTNHEAELYGMTAIDQIISAYPSAASANVVGYAMKGARSQLTYQTEVGNMARFTYDAYCTTEPLVRVNSMEGIVTKTSTGNGTDRSLGAVTAAHAVYCFLHVTAVSGTGTPTLTVKVQSSPDGSTWADKISMTAVTAIGAEGKSLAGANTDTHWRITWTISGTNPSFTFIAGVGIV